MPIALILVALDAFLIVHAAKTGRFWPWAYVILMIPGLGAIAYVMVELLPEWTGSHGARQARRGIGKALNPEKTYRALRDELDIADTIATRSALAEECLTLQKFDEAERQFEAILAQPLGDEPIYALGLARAQFGQGRAADAIATLDNLRQRWPDYQSGDGHLLYARALEETGRLSEALDEYRAVSAYYAGAEPRVRRGLLLRRLGREDEARDALADVVKQLRRAPRFAQRAQAEWITTAEKALRN